MEEKSELEELALKFSKHNDILFRQNSVFAITHHPELVEEDKRFEYEGKQDDSPAGQRFEYLGTRSEFARYQKLMKKQNS